MNNILHFIDIFYKKHVELYNKKKCIYKSKQVVFQIWGWYLKKWAFSQKKIGRSTKFSPLYASKTPLEHTVVWIGD